MVAGTMAGLFPGSGIGASLDKLCAARTRQAALETGPSVVPLRWRNRNTDNAGAITPTRTYRSAAGSLPGETLALFWAEVREITAELQPDSIYVLQVDAVLQDAARYPAGELPDSITIKGRGGTDFQPGFAWLHEHGVRPSCCLYLTDMECDSYPEAEPGYPVIYCNWGPPPGTRNREPWGERIDIGPA